MDLEVFFERERDRYLAQYRGFLDRQKAGCVLGSSEVKFELGGAQGVFGGVYCADFVNNDKGAEIVEFQPVKDRVNDPFMAEFGFMDIRVEAFSWDKVSLECDPQVLTAETLVEWFETWFDPYDNRLDPDAEFSECIHCAVVVDNRLTLDMGTAPIDALLTLLELYEQEGATRLLIS